MSYDQLIDMLFCPTMNPKINGRKRMVPMKRGIRVGRVSGRVKSEINTDTPLI